MRKATCLILGSYEDLHVQSVLNFLKTDSALVLDLETLASAKYEYKYGSLQIETRSGWIEINSMSSLRGWFRRLAPQDWQRDVRVGSLDAVEKTAWLSLLGAITRIPSIDWLSNVDNCLIAENKLFQIDLANRMGIKTPITVVSNVKEIIRSALPKDLIIKPLGPGHYFKDGQPYVMYTQSLNELLLSETDVEVPMLLQEKLLAIKHLRVVVVNDSVWGCSLDASGLPIDWRSDIAAHHSFEAITPPSEVVLAALRINAALKLGYSSQDWILTAEGSYLVDVNPGGQWMFLPEEVSLEVSRAIAVWLGGSDA